MDHFPETDKHPHTFGKISGLPVRLREERLAKKFPALVVAQRLGAVRLQAGEPVPLRLAVARIGWLGWPSTTVEELQAREEPLPVALHQPEEK